MELPRVDGFFLPVRPGACLFNGKIPNTMVLAVRCGFGNAEGLCLEMAVPSLLRS